MPSVPPSALQTDGHMTPFSLIARGDRGGLGSQTTELHRHLHPAKTLVMDCGDARGPTSLKEFTHGQVRINVGPVIEDANLTWLLEDVDVLFTVECDYADRRNKLNLWGRAREAGVRTILQANPELMRKRYKADVITVPTTWEKSRLPGPVHIPMPVARDRLPFRQRTSARTFLHVAAPAMADRNGTQLVAEAIRHLESDCRVIFRGDLSQLNHVQRHIIERDERVVLDDSSCENYWECWADEVDVLVLPRRYGGLCLPVQEAASLGIPALMTGIPPQCDWPGVTGVRSSATEQLACIGGEFPRYAARPQTLAQQMDLLTVSEDRVASLSHAAGEWAQSISWERLLPAYEKLIAA